MIIVFQLKYTEKIASVSENKCTIALPSKVFAVEQIFLAISLQNF